MASVIRLRNVNTTTDEVHTPARVVENPKAVPEKNALLEWKELPEWRRNNKYIRSGYRHTSGAVSKSVLSLLYIHNETVNIYSHILGSLLFFVLPAYFYHGLSTRYPTATTGDIIVFSTFFFGVALCFLFSATYHTLSNHSPGILAVGLQLDLLGIVILMWGSTIPTIFYGFHNTPRLQHRYWALVTTLSTACIAVTLNPTYRQPHLRACRAGMYSSLGLSALIPVVHGIMLNGFETQSRRMSLAYLIGTACFNFAGAVAYATRLPERWYPRRYDIWGCSHQWLHVMVIVAGLVHMAGLLRAFDYAHENTPGSRMKEFLTQVSVSEKMYAYARSGRHGLLQNMSSSGGVSEFA